MSKLINYLYYLGSFSCYTDQHTYVDRIRMRIKRWVTPLRPICVSAIPRACEIPGGQYNFHHGNRVNRAQKYSVKLKVQSFSCHVVPISACKLLSKIHHSMLK